MTRTQFLWGAGEPRILTVAGAVPPVLVRTRDEIP